MESLSKSKIDETTKSKYLEELSNYYKLKNKYIAEKESIKKSIINSDDSILSKKKILAKKQFKCVNCQKPGGTIFKETDKILHATCGNLENPCNLNIEIVKMSTILINEELTNINYLLENTKKSIVITKLNFLFNYIEEDKAVELFDELKLEFTKLQEKYNELFLLYTSVTDNEEKNNLLKTKIIEQNSKINEFNEYIKLYKTSQDKKYIKDAMELYMSNIKILDKDIREIKYKHNFLEEIEDNEDTATVQLVQKKYDLNDLEITKLPN